MISEEEFSKLLLRVFVDIGDSSDLKERFKSMGKEILCLSGLENSPIHSKAAIDELSTTILLDMIRWVTYDRNSVLFLLVKQLREFLKDKDCSRKDIARMLLFLEESLIETKSHFSKEMDPALS